jgi:hypothetical protein
MSLRSALSAVSTAVISFALQAALGIFPAIAQTTQQPASETTTKPNSSTSLPTIHVQAPKEQTSRKRPAESAKQKQTQTQASVQPQDTPQKADGDMSSLSTAAGALPAGSSNTGRAGDRAETSRKLWRHLSIAAGF